MKIDRPKPTPVSLDLIRTDGGTQPRAAIYQNTVDEYAAAVSEGAAFPPVVLFYDGAAYWLADGFHRLAAYKQANAAEIPADVRQGSQRDAILHSVGANDSHGLRRTNADKHRAVMTLLNDEEWSKWNDSEIARRCAVHQTTVGDYRRSLKVSLSERTYIDKHGNVSTMDTSAIGKVTTLPYDPVQAQEIIEQAKAIADADRDARRDLLHGENGLLSDGDKSIRGTQGTGDNEWYTPIEYVDLARHVLGEIDVDPASNRQAQRTVKAKAYFTLEDSGLDHDWRGRVWLNPPYAQPHIEQFADKIIGEIEARRVTAAIMLTHNYTDTAWFQKLAVAASAICFTRGRIRFRAPDGMLAAPTQGQAFFYFGADVSTFCEAFGSIGFIVGKSSVRQRGELQ